MVRNSNLNFECVEDFVDDIVDKVYEDDDLLVSVIAKFDEMKEILKYLTGAYDTKFDEISLCSPEIDAYVDEFILGCYFEDGVVYFNCEPVKRGGKYFILADYGEDAYVLDNCSPEAFDHCVNTNVYAVHIHNEDDECDDCCDCLAMNGHVQYAKSENGETHGFFTSNSTDDGYHSFSYYTTEPLSNDDITSMLKRLGFGVSQP